MNNHLTRRRPHGYVTDPSEQLLESSSFIPSFQGSVAYPYPQAFPHEEQIHVPHQSFLGFGVSYPAQSHAEAYQGQHQETYYQPEQRSRKRQRTDSMPYPSIFSADSSGHGDQEKSPPLSVQSEREDGVRESIVDSIGRCLSMSMCPPFSGYEIVPGKADPPNARDAHINIEAEAYQSASSTGYEGAGPRTYQPDFSSPIHQVPEYSVAANSGPGQPGLFDVEDSNHAAHLQNYPALQPVSHFSSQPTTSPESMVYPSLDADHSFLKSETSPVFLKTESAGQSFREPEFQSNPTAIHPGETNYAHSSVPRTEDESYIRQGLLNYPPPRYRVPPNYVYADGLGSEQVNNSQIVPHSHPLEVVLPSHKPPSTKRGPFKNQEKRQQTAHVRKIGSCIRCRMQRIRCETNSDAPDDDDAPCDGCKKILANSKIHRLPCRRWKITEVKLFKPGQVKGYEWTRRWKDGTAGPDIGQWASPEVKIIRLTEGYGDGVELRVRRFVPQPGDKLERTWVEDGKMQRKWIEPYALIDLEAAKASYETYLRSGLTQMCKALLGPTEKLLWRTYEFAMLRAQRPEITFEEKDLIRKTLDLWAAVRLTTKSFEIVGEETLGIPRTKGPVPIPPVMGAQIDNILLNQTLPKLRRETLETLQTMTQAKKQRTWLTTYLVTFILLHNVALITAHDEGYAKKHGMETRFARKDMVEQYHLGANIFLSYYHYCNKSVYPFSKDCKESDLQNLAELDQASINFVKYTRNYAEEHRRQWDDMRAAKEYSNDYYFLSQLYEQDWSPQPTIVD